MPFTPFMPFMLSDRPTRLDLAGLWLLAMAAAAVVGTHGILYWDAGDYVRLAIDGGPSGLLLGRPLFLLVSRGVLALGVEPASAEPVLRWFWTVIGTTASPAIAVLASRLGLGRAASLIVGASLALSPSFAHTAHQVLTDAPALALTIAALAAAARSQAIASGLLLAAAITTRETAAVHVVAIALLLGRRAVVALTIAALSVAVVVWAFPPPALAQWFQSMSKSTGAHPLGLRNIVIAIGWVFAAGPLPVLVGLWTMVRRPVGRWLVVSVPAAVATVLLLFYPDGSFSPRYVLATVPTAFFFGAGSWLASRPRWVVVGSLLVPLAAVPLASRSANAVATHGAGVMERVPNLPRGALVVPGHYCPHARLSVSIHHRQDLEMMCPGWDWPADPAATLDAALKSGRPLALDLSAEAWWGPRESPYRDAVRAWAAGRTGRDVAGFTVIQR